MLGGYNKQLFGHANGLQKKNTIKPGQFKDEEEKDDEISKAKSIHLDLKQLKQEQYRNSTKVAIESHVS